MATEIVEKTTVRRNLMTVKGYSPYCGNEECTYNWPRTVWKSGLNQFKCRCGWTSQFPNDFLSRYKSKWSK